MKLHQLVLLFFTLLFSTNSTSQSVLQDNAEISVLTVGPGENLSDHFGHSAFRIKNGKQDIVFGYGAYPFNDPNFILNFTRGKLNYSMDALEYKQFFYAYATYYKRSITEQVLNLNTKEKQKFYSYLLNNYSPENRDYLYDFFFDNCATKIKEVTNTALNDKVVFTNPENYKEKTYRTLIQDELDYNTWGSFGIDLALGSIIDQIAPDLDHMFLPKNIHSFFQSATVNNKPLIKSNTVLFKAKNDNKIDWLSVFAGPFLILSLVSLFIIYITYKDYKKETRSKTLDISLFAITGLIGVVLLLLWFATDHEMTAYNYNLLWAMPLNLVAIISIVKPKLSLRFSKYLFLLLIMLCLMIMHWIIGVQRFAPALAPIVIALFIRYAYLVYYFKKQ